MSAHSLLRDLSEAQGSPIGDPGSGGTILLRDRSFGFCELVSAGAESRTLPAPTRSGQWVVVSAKTAVGAITLTVTGGYNPNGSTNFTLDAAGEFIVLCSVRTAASTFVWRKVADHAMSDIEQADSAVLEVLSALTATADEINATSDVSTRMVTVTGTQLTVTAALYADRDVILDNTHTVTVVLPAASGSGNRYNFIVKTTGTDGSKIITVANTTDVVEGASLAVNTQSTTIGFIATATDDTITLNNTTTGGVTGTRVSILDIAAGRFRVEVFNITTGNPETPFSAT